MKYIFSKPLFCVLTTTLVWSVQGLGIAEEPAVQTPDPVIYLNDNLDEESNLGWCIDTVGRGFNEKIHAHSCKPRGGDVQFDFNANTSNIESVEFAGKCLTIVDVDNEKIPFGLLDCVVNQASQQFEYDLSSLQCHPLGDNSLCIVVGSSSRKAGPFMSRDLLLETCADTDSTRSQWVIKKN